MRLIRWLGLVALLVTTVHGFVYDYLYNGSGTALLFYPLGMAMIDVGNRMQPAEQKFPLPRILSSGRQVILGSLLAVVAALVFNLNSIMPVWYANLGAVQMSRAELKDFPTGKWATSEILHHLEPAHRSFQSALRYDPHNRTANYRLGLISMQRQDFETAAVHLETAYQAARDHRGIIKSLGYCYVWLGEIDKAETLLIRIPEAQHEMNVYVWWWETQGRSDLSERASQIVSRLEAEPP
jgi:tetratricopeptide (TPR) repeat protein